MRSRHRYAFVLLAALASLGASYRTTNFVVEAPDEKIAKKIGESAEEYRKKFALRWLGEEMPVWGRPCPLKVTVSMNGSGGSTEFAFDNGKILSIAMHIEGALDRLLASVLPHEITHTVLAHHFRSPLPRWADEGASVLSEDSRERAHHEQIAGTILQTPGRAMPLRRLLGLMGYPRDIMVLYAQGYSLSRFLIESENHKTFLAFVADGMKGDWDKACAKHYSYKNVEKMEGAWVKWVRVEKRKRERETAQNRLEKEVQLLKLENQLLQLELKQERQAAEWKQEQDRLKAKIRRARRTLKQLQEAAKSTSHPAPAAGSPVPVTPVPAKPPLLPSPYFPGPGC
ncbi:MAG: hypothetical protein ACRELF_00240 [Gemmataceae bacterium]